MKSDSRSSGCSDQTDHTEIENDNEYHTQTKTHRRRARWRAAIHERTAASAAAQDRRRSSRPRFGQRDDEGVRPEGRAHGLCVWGWPRVYAHNRRGAFAKAPMPGLMTPFPFRMSPSTQLKSWKLSGSRSSVLTFYVQRHTIGR